MKNVILFFSFLFLSVFTYASEPTAVNLTNDGGINWVYYDFNNRAEVHPLTGIYFSGKGKVKYLRLTIEGYSFLLDEFGTTVNTIQGSFEVEWNNNKIERFKRDYNTIVKFYYDSDGRLESIKDGSYNELFSLRYSIEGRIEKIGKGNYDDIMRFSYDSSDRLDGIKDGSYNYFWRLYYDFDGSLERIKDGNYNERLRIDNWNQQARNITKQNSQTNFTVGNVQVDYLSGYIGSSTPFCGTNTTAVNYGINADVYFFKEAQFTGNKLVYTLASEYPVIPADWNDQISSIRIPVGVKVIVYEHENFLGESFVLNADWSINYSGEFWNNRISSIKITYQ